MTGKGDELDRPSASTARAPASSTLDASALTGERAALGTCASVRAVGGGRPDQIR
jgi:hypothetical protein